MVFIPPNPANQQSKAFCWFLLISLLNQPMAWQKRKPCCSSEKRKGPRQKGKLKMSMSCQTVIQFTVQSWHAPELTVFQAFPLRILNRSSGTSKTHPYCLPFLQQQSTRSSWLRLIYSDDVFRLYLRRVRTWEMPRSRLSTLAIQHHHYIAGTSHFTAGRDAPGIQLPRRRNRWSRPTRRSPT